MLARGFLSQRARLYPFDSWARDWFLTDWEVESRFGQVNAPGTQLALSNKLCSALLFESVDPAAMGAKAIGLSVDGGFASFPRRGEERPADFEAAFAAHDRLVAKPVSGRGGNGVRICAGPGDVDRNGFLLLETEITQHSYAAEIFPEAVNTIRVLTLRDPATGAPHATAAAHRFGTRVSAPVDNFSRGGLSAAVDMATGTLSAARGNPGIHPHGYYAAHLETGAAIEGRVVPHWPAALDVVLRLTGDLPGLHLAGWDICITSEGPRVVEGNATVPHVNLFQAHRPLLIDPVARRFFAWHGVLSSRRIGVLDRLAGNDAGQTAR